MASSATGRPLPPDLVSFGEVGLAGEVRQVSAPERRLNEAARLGFTRALVPAATPQGRWPLELIRVRSLLEGLAAVEGPAGRVRPAEPAPFADV